MNYIKHSWNLSYQDAIAVQKELASHVITHDRFDTINYIAGVDVAYNKTTNHHTAAIVVLDAQTLHTVETTTATIPTVMPYIPGLLSFREIPAIMAALEKLTIKPDLIICDGNGIAHPRRLGIASHLGVLCDIPTIGCAKKKLLGTHAELPSFYGAQVPLIHKNEIIGAVMHTNPRFKPLYISIGHRVSLETACDWTLKTHKMRYRLPEPTRLAHNLAGLQKTLATST